MNGCNADLTFSDLPLSQWAKITPLKKLTGRFTRIHLWNMVMFGLASFSVSTYTTESVIYTKWPLLGVNWFKITIKVYSSRKRGCKFTFFCDWLPDWSVLSLKSNSNIVFQCCIHVLRETPTPTSVAIPWLLYRKLFQLLALLLELHCGCFLRGNPRVSFVSGLVILWVHISENSKSDTKHLCDVSWRGRRAT